MSLIMTEINRDIYGILIFDLPFQDFSYGTSHQPATLAFCYMMKELYRLQY